MKIETKFNLGDFIKVKDAPFNITGDVLIVEDIRISSHFSISKPLIVYECLDTMRCSNSISESWGLSLASKEEIQKFKEEHHHNNDVSIISLGGLVDKLRLD